MRRNESPPVTLVCFAVRQESKPFSCRADGLKSIRILLTGMGRRNAESALRAALSCEPPAQVLSCGFAGGLRPGLPRGRVLFATDANPALEASLIAAGAQPGRFHCAERVLSLAHEKRSLWQSTGADAVEMESDFIRRICRERSVLSATLRVVLDTAEEDLPLDFSQMMTPSMRLDAVKLGLALIRSPRKIAGLLRLQDQARSAAESLAQVLQRLLGG